jgi:hypothetical protein
MSYTVHNFITQLVRLENLMNDEWIGKFWYQQNHHILLIFKRNVTPTLNLITSKYEQPYTTRTLWENLTTHFMIKSYDNWKWLTGTTVACMPRTFCKDYFYIVKEGLHAC